MATCFADVRDEGVEVCDRRLRLHVKVAGNGPPVVFFHPLPGLAWQPLLERLAERYTVYAPEHPGTSPGDPQAIREVYTLWELLLAYEEALRALGLDRPAVVGMSFGGMIAADLAASFPEALSRLVLICPIGLWRDDAPIRLVEMVTGPPEELPTYLFKYPESEAAQALMALPDDPDQVPTAIAQGVWNIGCTTKFAWPIADHGLGRRLHRIAVPTLVLWGRDDALVPVVYAEEFASRIEGSRVELLDDCGTADVVRYWHQVTFSNGRQRSGEPHVAAAWCLVIRTLIPPIDWPGTIEGFLKENLGVFAAATPGTASAATTRTVDGIRAFMAPR